MMLSRIHRLVDVKSSFYLGDFFFAFYIFRYLKNILQTFPFLFLRVFFDEWWLCVFRCLVIWNFLNCLGNFLYFDVWKFGGFLFEEVYVSFDVFLDKLCFRVYLLAVTFETELLRDIYDLYLYLYSVTDSYTYFIIFSLISFLFL